MKGFKLLLGVLLVALGIYLFYGATTWERAKVTHCIIVGIVAIATGIANIANWSKQGWFLRWDKALDDKVFGMFKHANNPPNDAPRPEKPTPAPPDKTDTRVIKDAEVVPPEPQLLRPSIKSRETLDINDINDLLKRG